MGFHSDLIVILWNLTGFYAHFMGFHGDLKLDLMELNGMFNEDGNKHGDATVAMVLEHGIWMECFHGIYQHTLPLPTIMINGINPLYNGNGNGNICWQSSYNTIIYLINHRITNI